MSPTRQYEGDWPTTSSVWVEAVERCSIAAGARLPNQLDRRALAEFVLTTMEGGVMQARTHRDVAYFDRAVAQLRTYFDSASCARRRVRPPRGQRSPRARKVLQ